MQQESTAHLKLLQQESYCMAKVKWTITNGDKKMEKPELSYTSGENVQGYSHVGEDVHKT
jgi:hypothetical protein